MTEQNSPETVTVLLDNTLEALNRVVSVLRARQCAVESLSLAATGSREVQQLSFTMRASQRRLLQVISWLRRIEEVREVHSVPPFEVREWLLLSVRPDVLDAPAVSRLVLQGMCRVVGNSSGWALVEAFGDSPRMDEVLTAFPPDSVMAVTRVGPQGRPTPAEGFGP